MSESIEPTGSRGAPGASATSDPTPAAARPARFGVARIIIVVVLGVIAAWFLYDGIGSLVNLPQLFAELELADETPWPALWLGALQAPALFIAAAIGARRLSAPHYALVLIAALGAIAATRLSIIAAATGTLAIFSG